MHQPRLSQLQTLEAKVYYTAYSFKLSSYFWQRMWFRNSTPAFPRKDKVCSSRWMMAICSAAKCCKEFGKITKTKKKRKTKLNSRTFEFHVLSEELSAALQKMPSSRPLQIDVFCRLELGIYSADVERSEIGVWECAWTVFLVKGKRQRLPFRNASGIFYF